jgi:hypothetical protein
LLAAVLTSAIVGRAMPEASDLAAVIHPSWTTLIVPCPQPQQVSGRPMCRLKLPTVWKAAAPASSRRIEAISA